MILPALTETTNPFFRPIKYSLFPPLGLATLAAYLSDDDDVTICDKHVEELRLDDEPDLVVVQVYITGEKDLCLEVGRTAFRQKDQRHVTSALAWITLAMAPKHGEAERPGIE